MREVLGLTAQPTRYLASIRAVEKAPITDASHRKSRKKALCLR
jgi:hypothetical protein